MFMKSMAFIMHKIDLLYIHLIEIFTISVVRMPKLQRIKLHLIEVIHG